MFFKILNLFFILFSFSCAAQFPTSHPVSTQAEIGHGACKDTLRVLSYEREYDIGVILPSWPSVVSDAYVAVLEGYINSESLTGAHGPHITFEDLPFYHYTHDVNFDITPDETPDQRYTNLSPLMVYEGEHGISDTVLRKTVHVEWESGLGSYNLLNPVCRKLNNAGKSAGFFSAGHERGDLLWNWPTVGDWAHVEGHYVWDRGHPPAYTEIHPPRFVLLKRSLPHLLKLGGLEKYCMRVDIFASGDGGALHNNRSGVKDFVRKVNMSSKDYEVTVRMNLPRPSPTAQLKFLVRKHKGDSFQPEEIVAINAEAGTATVTLPWMSKNVSDLEIYARTFYFYWDEGNGTVADFSIDKYNVKWNSLRFKKLSEVDGNAELRACTDCLVDRFPERCPAVVFQKAHQVSPLGRSSRPEDVARTVRFVLENESMTASQILVDGGQHLMHLPRDISFL